ncbi:MAG: diadenylate cyclase [Actinomycetota bacterium]|nr:diadenylate cyclase [Actinomycetota bacterium]
MGVRIPSSRALRRLEEELEEDHVPLPDEPELRAWVIEELHAVRRPPVHERRRAFYGSFVMPPGRSLLVGGDLSDVVELGDYDIALGRRFADGRSTFLVRHPDGTTALACFRRAVQYEADLVEIQEATGAVIAQRTVMGTARLFVEAGVIEWNGHRWSQRATAAARVPAVARHAVGVSLEVVEGLLDLCVHWLSPGQVGGTVVLVLTSAQRMLDYVDAEDSIPAPPLSVRHREHFPAFLAAMSQTDLATVLDDEGNARAMGVGLRSTASADLLVSDRRGMRHRSGRRFSFDHPQAIVFVVSEDGPVTVFSDGAEIATRGLATQPPIARSIAPTEEQRCARCRRLIEVIVGVSATTTSACPVCGALEGFEETTVVGVVKEATWRAAESDPQRPALPPAAPAHLALGDLTANNPV